jgi:hypothetical protein
MVFMILISMAQFQGAFRLGRLLDKVNLALLSVSVSVGMRQAALREASRLSRMEWAVMNEAQLQPQEAGA